MTFAEATASAAVTGSELVWLIIGGGIVGCASVSIPLSIIAWRDPSPNFLAAGKIFSNGDGLRFSTVLTVVFAVIFLSISGSMSEGAIALLSGVAGYVLGGIKKQREASPPVD